MRWLLLLLLTSNIYSQKWEVDITLGTYHYDRYYLWNLQKYEFNEFNPGAIFYYNQERVKYGGGLILNSYNRVSYVTGIGYTINPKLSILGGVATGYGKTDMDKSIMPMAIITYQIGRFKLGASPVFVMGMLNFKL